VKSLVLSSISINSSNVKHRATAQVRIIMMMETTAPDPKPMASRQMGDCTHPSDTISSTTQQ
jgi:hypothetical protein